VSELFGGELQPEEATVKVAFSILNMPDRSWHWVARVWEHGLEAPCTIHKADRGYGTAREALDAASKRWAEREQAAAQSNVAAAVVEAGQ
jgi:hypothetical protein